jgi:hypothetical protein
MKRSRLVLLSLGLVMALTAAAIAAFYLYNKHSTSVNTSAASCLALNAGNLTIASSKIIIITHYLEFYTYVNRPTSNALISTSTTKELDSIAKKLASTASTLNSFEADHLNLTIRAISSEARLIASIASKLSSQASLNTVAIELNSIAIELNSIAIELASVASKPKLSCN